MPPDLSHPFANEYIIPDVLSPFRYKPPVYKPIYCISVLLFGSFLNSQVSFIDVFELNSPFIGMHNQCIINVTRNVMVC